jgi:hypothetical protein
MLEKSEELLQDVDVPINDDDVIDRLKHEIVGVRR